MVIPNAKNIEYATKLLNIHLTIVIKKLMNNNAFRFVKKNIQPLVISLRCLPILFGKNFVNLSVKPKLNNIINAKPNDDNTANNLIAIAASKNKKTPNADTIPKNKMVISLSINDMANPFPIFISYFFKK